jgi:hypothetical protein
MPNEMNEARKQLTFYQAHFSGRLKKTAKVSHQLGKGSNLRPTELETEVLTTRT